MAILKGSLGFKGEAGDSAYEIAVKNGYEGTEAEWIAHFGLDLSGYVQTTDVVDNLTSTYTTKPLSAKQGKELDTAKQDKLVSGTNIKSINNNSILGTGNINLPSTSEIGDVANLETTATDVVGAINELDENIGNLDMLNTTAKDSIVNAINEIDANTEDSGWVNLIPSKGTWNVLRVRRIGDLVYLEGDASSYAWSGSAETFATIPESYRPAWHKYTYGFSSGKTLSRLYIATGGGLGVDWLINISNAADNTNQVWLRFYCVYAAA